MAIYHHKSRYWAISIPLPGRLDLTHSSVDQTIFLRLNNAYSLAGKDGVLPLSAPRISPEDINVILICDSQGKIPVQSLPGSGVKSHLHTHRDISLLSGDIFHWTPYLKIFRIVPFS